jgi:hypothetical protein
MKKAVKFVSSMNESSENEMMITVGLTCSL